MKAKGLVGYYCFEKIRNQGCEYDTLGYTGRVTDDLGSGYYLVQLYSAISGDPRESQIFSIQELRHWLFIGDEDLLEFSSKYGTLETLRRNTIDWVKEKNATT